MPVFPSTEWFQAVADLVNHDPEYRKLGACDALVGVRVDDRVWELVFDAFEVTKVEEIDLTRADDMDFTLTLPMERWREMLENIKEHGRAELQHTLNSIDLGSTEELAVSKDIDRQDIFFRMNQSFQHFFDLSAKIDTQFAEPARA